MGPPSPLRAAAILALALSLTACGEAVAPAVIDNGPIVRLRASTAFNLGVCVADAVDRIMPALGPSDDLKGIASSLALVNSALESRVLPQLTTSTKSFNEALDAFFAARPELAVDPDAAVLRLLLEDLTAVAAYPPLDTLRTH